MDVDVVRMPDLGKKLGNFPEGVCMPEIEREANTLNAPGHSHEFPGIPAEEFFLADHVLEAGKHPVLDRTLPDLAQGFFLEFPDFLGQEFSCRGKIARVDGDPVSEFSCMSQCRSQICRMDSRQIGSLSVARLRSP